MNKSQLWSQNSLRQTCNVFCLYLYQAPVQAEGCFAYWMLGRKIDKSHSFNTNNFNLKQVKSKPVEVCITWKVIGFLEFYIFPGY